MQQPPPTCGFIPDTTSAVRAWIASIRRGELKKLLVDVGLELLAEEGLARGTERLTFKRVFDRAGAERGVRGGWAAHREALSRARKADINVGLRGLSVSCLPMKEATPTAAIVRSRYAESAARWDYVFEQAFVLIGVRMRPGFTVRQLTMLAIALTEGFPGWDRVAPTHSRHILRPTGPADEQQEWTLFSLGPEGLGWQFAELVDGADAGVLQTEEAHPPDISGNRRYPTSP